MRNRTDMRTDTRTDGRLWKRNGEGGFMFSAELSAVLRAAAMPSLARARWTGRRWREAQARRKTRAKRQARLSAKLAMEAWDAREKQRAADWAAERAMLGLTRSQEVARQRQVRGNDRPRRLPLLVQWSDVGDITSWAANPMIQGVIGEGDEGPEDMALVTQAA